MMCTDTSDINGFIDSNATESLLLDLNGSVAQFRNRDSSERDETLVQAMGQVAANVCALTDRAASKLREERQPERGRARPSRQGPPPPPTPFEHAGPSGRAARTPSTSDRRWWQAGGAATPACKTEPNS